MSNEKILIVHPYDRSTSFLAKIKNELESKFPGLSHYFSVKPTTDSHNNCLERIANHPATGFILFLGHGRSECLFGAKADGFGAYLSEEAVRETPDLDYHNENFINEANIEVFKGKKVICLSCFSNNKIAKIALEKGVVSFLGFGNIPTSKGEFYQDGLKNVPSVLVSLMKYEINSIIKKGLYHAIAQKAEMGSVLDIIQFIASQRIAYILTLRNRRNENHILVDYLYYLKKEAKIFGNKKITLIE